MDTFDVTIQNKDYVDGKWTSFDGKLPEGVFILRCQTSSGEWFNHKARFQSSKGWTPATAEEWARKYRPYKTASEAEKPQDLGIIIGEVPKLSQAEVLRREEERRKALMTRQKVRKFSFRELMFGKKTEEKDDIERILPKDMKQNHIHVGDCVEIMECFPNNYFDAVVTDPPYNLGKKYKSGIDDALRAKDYYEWSYRWIDEATRVLKPGGQILIALWDRFKYNIQVYANNRHKDKLRFIQEIAWKTTGVPRAGTGKLRSDMTPWLHFGPSLKKGEPVVNYTWNMDDVRSWKFVKHKKSALSANRKYIHPLGKDPSTLWEFYKEKDPNEFKDQGANFYVLNWLRKFLEVFAEYSLEHTIKLFDVPSNIIDQRNLPATHRDRLDHPCQMPVEVPMRIIKLVTNPGDVILEPFLGTGTTAHAATVLGRHCVGIELSPDYALMAHERLNRAHIAKQAAVEYWDGRPPKWTIDECTPQFDDPRQKSLIDFFAVGTAGAKRLGDDLVSDVARELQTGDFSAILGF